MLHPLARDAIDLGQVLLFEGVRPHSLTGQPRGHILQVLLDLLRIGCLVFAVLRFGVLAGEAHVLAGVEAVDRDVILLVQFVHGRLVVLAELDTGPLLRIFGLSLPIELLLPKDPGAGAMARTVQVLNSVGVDPVVFQILPDAGSLPLRLEILITQHIVFLLPHAVKILGAGVRLDDLQELALVLFRVVGHREFVAHPWDVVVQQLAAAASYDIHLALFCCDLRQF